MDISRVSSKRSLVSDGKLCVSVRCLPVVIFTLIIYYTTPRNYLNITSLSTVTSTMISFSLLLSYKEMETVSHSILCINVDQLFLLKY